VKSHRAGDGLLPKTRLFYEHENEKFVIATKPLEGWKRQDRGRTSIPVSPVTGPIIVMDQETTDE
jgi:hypothetical protein